MGTESTDTILGICPFLSFFVPKPMASGFLWCATTKFRNAFSPKFGLLFPPFPFPCPPSNDVIGHSSFAFACNGILDGWMPAAATSMGMPASPQRLSTEYSPLLPFLPNSLESAATAFGFHPFQSAVASSLLILPSFGHNPPSLITQKCAQRSTFGGILVWSNPNGKKSFPSKLHYPPPIPMALSKAGTLALALTHPFPHIHFYITFWICNQQNETRSLNTVSMSMPYFYLAFWITN